MVPLLELSTPKIKLIIMILKKSNCIVTTSFALVLIASAGTVAFAQERAEVNTNVCDGVTCSDGSCVATPDMCVAMEGEVAEGDTPDGSQESDSAVAPTQSYNATRSNKPTAVNGGGDDCNDTDERCTPGAVNTVCDTIDDDCDGDSLGDGQQAQDYNSVRSNKPGSVSGGDCDDAEREITPGECSGSAADEAAVAPAQDYNSSRSNKPNTAANPFDGLDDDDDGDGLPTEARARAAVQGKLFGEYVSADASAATKALKKGDRLSTSESENTSDDKPDFARFSDITGEVRIDKETGRRELSSVAVAARNLRDWNSDDREAFDRLQTAVASNTPEQASLRIAQQVLNNDRIEKIEATQTESRINYRAQIRLFGLIPVEREVQGRAQADGAVEIDYPWYRFLSTTPDREEIENQLRMSIEIMMADPV
jgi:hypothetical protein